MDDNISFDEHRIKPTTSSTAPKGLIGFLINKCGVKNESTANIILLVIAIIIFILAGVVLFGSAS